MQTADELLAAAVKRNPHTRFAWNGDKHTLMAFWDGESQRWIGIAGKGADEQWYQGPLPLVNGRPVVAQDEWVEVQYA